MKNTRVIVLKTDIGSKFDKIAFFALFIEGQQLTESYGSEFPCVDITSQQDLVDTIKQDIQAYAAKQGYSIASIFFAWPTPDDISTISKEASTKTL